MASRDMIKLDKLDVKILQALQRDGRMTKLRLAEAINLSPTPCWVRLNRLEEAGVIRGYSAHINIGKFARATSILVTVSLARHRLVDMQEFERAVQSIPEIVECYATGGGFDYLLRIITRDIESYEAIIGSLLTASVGIERYFTYVVTRAVKENGDIPVETLVKQQ